MPLPFMLAAGAGIAAVTGIAKGAKAVSDNSHAKDLIASAEYMYNQAKESMEHQRDKTTEQLNSLGEAKLSSWANDIGSFISIFSEFKNVTLESDVHLDDKLKNNIENVGDMRQMQVASLKASEVLGAGVGSLGAGALAGIASYGGAMMFASASTGTAIASLSGVAATNATLAWFGGGSLAAGGLGMAGGTLVLGGIVAGPVLAVAGFIMAAKAKENLANARSIYAEAENAIEKINTMASFMNSVEKIAYEYECFIIGFSQYYQRMLLSLKKLKENALRNQERLFSNKTKKIFGIKTKVDFKLLQQEEQQLLHISWLMTQILNAVLSTPLLTNLGDLDENSETILDGAKVSAENLINSSKNNGLLTIGVNYE